MTLTLFAGSAHPGLGAAVAAGLGQELGASEIHAFPDSELSVGLRQSVRGHDVYILQPTAPPTVERHLVELLLLADAARRAGAARLTAVIPYLGYARQDRRATGREAGAARVIADLIDTRGFARLVALHLHSVALEGFFGTPVEHLSAVPLLATALAPQLPADGVVVAPDLGAAKLAERYARVLRLPVAIVHKERQAGAEVSVRAITGDVRNRVPIIVDDMITTGATIVAAQTALVAAGCKPGLIVAATHPLLVDGAVGRLRTLNPRRLIVTDSVAARENPSSFEVVSVASLLAEAISRLHHERSLQDLLAHE
ncbi:MAG TPA: ribose-phosphate pyrophosphokinase [Gemmatimonadales bacterium]|nr:ribose-phosphate pyrophosphokinase [Gemmatimonadales bacterium]